MNDRAYRTILLLTACLVLGVSHGQAQETTTLVNTTGTPFSYLLVESGFPADPGLIVEQLRNQAPNLRELAAHALWRIPRRPATLIGYFHEQASAVSGGVVHVALDGSAGVQDIGQELLVRDDAGRIQVSRWDTPARPAPISLDGRAEDWSPRVPLLRRRSLREPTRVEGAALAEDWNRGGAGLRTLRSVLGPRSWFIGIETDTPIEAGTAYHLRYFPDAGRRRAIGEFSVLIDGPGGPVVFRSSSGNIQLIGQYVRSGRFLEFSIDLEMLDAIAPGFRSSGRSFDLATSTQRGGVRTRYSHAVLSAGELFGR